MINNTIELNKEYKLNLHSSLSLLTLRYPFKPSSIDINNQGSLEVDKNTNDYNIKLLNTKQTIENFKSQSHNVNKVNNNEYVLLFDDNEFKLIKPCIDVYNIKHIQQREYVNTSTINNNNSSNDKKRKNSSTPRKLIAESLITCKPVQKKANKSKQKIKKPKNDNKVYDTKNRDKLMLDLKRDGWITSKTDSNYISVKCRKFYDDTYSDGTVIAHLTAANNDGTALWFFLHDDGDSEDFEENDIIKCKEYYDKQITDAPEENKRHIIEDIDYYESEDD